MGKTKLSIYLIKAEYAADYTRAVEMNGVSSTQKLTDIGVVYTKKSTPHTPRWVTGFFGNEVPSKLFVSSSASALLLTRIASKDEARLFAISFGYGYTLLKIEAIEERFGLRVALNACGAESLRKVRRTSVAGNARKTSEQLPRRSSIDEFGMDIERDLLEGVTVECDEDTLVAGSVTGGDALSLSADVDVHSIGDLLKKIYDLYKKDSYKQSFGWVDQISSVKSPAVIEALEKHTVELINAGNPTLWLAVPEVINWESIEGFKIGRNRKLKDDILIEDVLKSLGKKGLTDFDQLKRKRIRVIGEESGETLRQWSAAQCLYGELDYEGSVYCANGGKWYKLDQGYREAIEASFNRTEISQMDFPDCIASRESEYNRCLAEADSVHRALLDAKNIEYGGGRSMIELCDVLCDDGSFIHVKFYSGSATLSHLFSQGLVSASLVKQDEEFVEAANEKIEAVAPGFEMRVGADTLKEVIYGIATKEDGERPQIPFFSKVTLDYVKRQFGLMGVRVSIKAIHRISNSPN